MGNENEGITLLDDFLVEKVRIDELISFNGNEQIKRGAMMLHRCLKSVFSVSS